MPWLGVMEMAGLRKKEAGYYGLNVPAIQLMALVPAAPAAEAGLQPGQIVVGLDGKPLERGDSVEQIPLMLRRQLLHRAPGSKIILSVVSEPGATPKDVCVTLGVGPTPAILADRWWSPDYGFGVRDLVMFDRVTQHMPDDATGVIVSVVKPNTPAATANLQANQFVSRVDGQPIHDSKDFAKKFGAWRTAHPHDAAILLVRREGHDQTVRIEPSQTN